MILITGASGNAGGAVLREVLKSGSGVRAMYRSKEEAAKAAKGATAVIADFADKQSLRGALEGVDTVYLVCSPVRELVELESNMIDACREAGVKHVVLNSALGAGDFPKSFPSWHRKVEDKLKASGMNYTMLRPNGFMQNLIAYFAPSIRAQGAFYQSTGDAKVSHVNLRDIAAAAAAILRSRSQHAGKIYELNGPEALSYAEVAEKISKATGRKVQYVDIPPDAQRKALLDMGMPDFLVTALLELQEYYASGKASKVDGTLESLIHRAPIKMDAFLTENADQFREQAAKA
ncbi:MAG TPA: SDR family oxidoreductase [Methylomirabilota bacterium]|nr:SDR family oxidoreductase [Methylomirabilota bacterium]